jgi:hypothetical protein
MAERENGLVATGILPVIWKREAGSPSVTDDRHGGRSLPEPGGRTAVRPYPRVHAACHALFSNTDFEIVLDIALLLYPAQAPSDA